MWRQKCLELRSLEWVTSFLLQICTDQRPPKLLEVWKVNLPHFFITRQTDWRHLFHHMTDKYLDKLWSSVRPYRGVYVTCSLRYFTPFSLLPSLFGPLLLFRDEITISQCLSMRESNSIFLVVLTVYSLDFTWKRGWYNNCFRGWKYTKCHD